MIPYKELASLKSNNESGIWLEFSNQEWIFVVKDQYWTPEEISIFLTSPVKFSFFEKGVVNGFLVEVKDVLEISDCPFCILEATRGFLNTLKDQQVYQWSVLLVDEKNNIVARRHGEMSFEMSAAIKKALREQRFNVPDVRSFNSALTRLQKRFEPYELKAFVLHSEQIQSR